MDALARRPGEAVELPLHRITVRFLDECSYADNRTALAYRLGFYRGHHWFRLADEDGTPIGRVWGATEDEIVRDVPAEFQPAELPESVRRQSESLLKGTS